MQHTPVSRGILGQDVRLSVDLSPAGSYRVQVHYRALPGGSWQSRTSYGGEAGPVTVVIPGGDWQAEDSTAVEYYLTVDGGAASSGGAGSAGAPFRYSLF